MSFVRTNPEISGHFLIKQSSWKQRYIAATGNILFIYRKAFVIAPLTAGQKTKEKH